MIITIIIIFLIIFFCIYISSLCVTILMSHKYGWGTYKKFKKEFNKIETKTWENDGFFSLSSGYSKTKILASMVQFNNIGMIFDPITWILVLIFIRKYKKDNYLLRRIKW